MIADDSDAIRLVLEDILTLAEHELVGEAKDGAEAVEKFNILKPDLLLLDLTNEMWQHRRRRHHRFHRRNRRLAAARRRPNAGLGRLAVDAAQSRHWLECFSDAEHRLGAAEE